ncbi:hypothetical protein EJ05DRAFT_475855 [Pseudovirgaria hyperparasitica]|uniref:BHLH domain-containing protein n=1 Tax=Pseudovirgaria hyperparasitica TaxID=470096 RepID=A0A6A6W6Q8_9PEZI|nr:uncharacterized protein EJ05DRAFT_475855 [Pseudovirgaria hyperparasitica]KAF2758552.1 hypothetical protein EJ05DRAFT_475855 [Pseudovirgaria hyperparasitica]
MSLNWDEFLVGDAFDFPQWPESAEYKSMPPLSTNTDLHTANDPQSYGYTPYEDSTYEQCEYTTLPDSSRRTSRPLQSDINFGPAKPDPTKMAVIHEDNNPSIPSKLETQESPLTKRTKNSTDNISACWTSPLCPNNHGQGESPPDPASCGGGCAPFLFGDPQDSPASALNDTIPANEISIDPDTLEPPANLPPSHQHLKRSDSNRSAQPQGSRTTTTQTPPKPEHSNITSSNSPPADDPSPEAPHDHSSSSSSHAKPPKRQPHNQVERKYRESLNTQLESLKKVVPSLKPKTPCAAAVVQPDDIEDLPAPSKPSKAVILASATAYIRQMERDKRDMADEIEGLRRKVAALSALVKCEDCTVMQYVMNLNLGMAK